MYRLSLHIFEYVTAWVGVVSRKGRCFLRKDLFFFGPSASTGKQRRTVTKDRTHSKFETADVMQLSQ